MANAEGVRHPHENRPALSGHAVSVALGLIPAPTSPRRSPGRFWVFVGQGMVDVGAVVRHVLGGGAVDERLRRIGPLPRVLRSRGFRRSGGILDRSGANLVPVQEEAVDGEEERRLRDQHHDRHCQLFDETHEAPRLGLSQTMVSPRQASCTLQSACLCRLLRSQGGSAILPVALAATPGADSWLQRRSGEEHAPNVLGTVTAPLTRSLWCFLIIFGWWLRRWELVRRRGEKVKRPCQKQDVDYGGAQE
jgi:hypothetical protein